MFGIPEAVVGWVIGEGLDWRKDKIKAALEGRALAASQESYETKMYQAIVNALNKISYQWYQGQDRIYEAAEVFVKDWTGKGCLDTAVPKRALELVPVETSLDRCEGFIELLYGEISKVEELRNRHMVGTTSDILANTIDILKQGEILKAGISDLSKKQDEMAERIGGRLREQESAHPNKFANNKKKEYIKKWKSKLFLHEDETDQRYTLERAFIPPDYKINGNGKPHTDLEKLLEEFIESQSTNKNTLLILGVPGIGKTSLVSYLANEYSDYQNLIILRFADLDDNDLVQGLTKAVCKKLDCEKDDLQDQILILDGFDEIKYSGDRNDLLKVFLLDIKGLDSFKLLVTSRGNYINHKAGFKNVIELDHFDAGKINSFSRELFNIDVQDNICDNEEVLGIPVILYMALTVGVDIYEKSSKSELYEKIFALEGGIYDRFSIKGTSGYTRDAHHVEYNKEDFHSILQLLAFKIFDANSDSKSISKSAYEMVIESHISGCSKALDEQQLKMLKDITFDFPIRNLFDKTASQVEFIHRSIYEYFVAEYIYVEFKQQIQGGDEKGLAKCLSRLLKGNILTPEIVEFLFFKFERNSVILHCFGIIKVAFDLMMKDGMTYYLEEKVSQIIFAEKRILCNLLEIIYFWSHEEKFNLHIDQKLYFAALILVRGGHSLYRLKLKKFNLEQMEMKGVDLAYANLIGANLRKANLREANLIGANLIGANLTGTNLRGANLREADSREADLIEANLIEANLGEADLSEANLSGANLRKANLREANLIGADLRKANLREANLIGADLRGADLTGAYLRGVDVGNALFDIINVRVIENQSSDQLDLIRVVIPHPDTEDEYKIVSYKQYKDWLQKQKAKIEKR